MAEAFQDLNAQAAPNATETIHPRQWLSPGWYWAFLDTNEAGAQWTAFTRANPLVKTTKTVGLDGAQVTAGQKGSWVLFEVQGTNNVIWTLPGFPTRAFKGALTEYSDVIDQSQNTPAPENALSDFLKNLGEQLGTAGKVILWGGVAIVLWQVLQKTGGASRRSSGDSDYEEREEHHVTVSRPRRTRQGTMRSYT